MRFALALIGAPGQDAGRDAASLLYLTGRLRAGKVPHKKESSRCVQPGSRLVLLFSSLVLSQRAGKERDRLATAATWSAVLCQRENCPYPSVGCALFLPRSDRLVLGGGDWLGPGELAFSVTTSLKREKVLTEHKLAICSVAASPDGSRIATGGGFGEVKIYDSKTNKVLAHLDAGGEYTDALAFSSDGRLLANGAMGAVTLWDVKTHKTLFSAGREGIRAWAGVFARRQAARLWRRQGGAVLGCPHATAEVHGSV